MVKVARPKRKLHFLALKGLKRPRQSRDTGNRAGGNRGAGRLQQGGGLVAARGAVPRAGAAPRLE